MGQRECEIRELTKVAYGLLDSGENVKATEYFETAARKAKEAGNPVTILTSYLNAGACLVSQGEYGRGRIFLQFALKLLESTEGWSPKPPDLNVRTMTISADLHHYLGISYHQLKDNSIAIEQFTSSTELYLSEGLPKLAAESLTFMSHCYRDLGNTEKEVQTLKKRLEIYHELGDIPKEAESCMALANIYFKGSKINDVKQMLSMARLLCQRVSSNEDGSKLYGDLGLLYCSLESYSSAVDCFERALTMTQQLPQTVRTLQSEASNLQNIGAVYNEKGMFSESVPYHQEAITVQGKLGNHNAQSKCLCNLATAQISLGLLEEAAVSFSNALAAAHQGNNIYLQVQACEGLGSINLKLQKYGDSVGYFQDALKLLDNIKLDTGIARERIMEKLSGASELLQEVKGDEIQYDEEGFPSRDEDSVEFGEAAYHVHGKKEANVGIKKLPRSLTPEFAAVEQTPSNDIGKEQQPRTPKMKRKMVSLQERRGVQHNLQPIQTGLKESQMSPMLLPSSSSSQNNTFKADKGKGKWKKQPSSEESDSNSLQKDLQAFVQSYDQSSNEDEEDRNLSSTSRPTTGSLREPVGQGSLAIGSRAWENFKVIEVEEEYGKGKKKRRRIKSKIVPITETEHVPSVVESEEQTENRTQQSKVCIIL